MNATEDLENLFEFFPPKSEEDAGVVRDLIAKKKNISLADMLDNAKLGVILFTY